MTDRVVIGNNEAEWFDEQGKRIGTAFMFDNGDVVLRLCPKCGFQNYCLNKNVCGYCTFEAKV